MSWFLYFMCITVIFCYESEGVSEERFLKLVQLVESQNARINDLEKTVQDQQGLIEHLYKRLEYFNETGEKKYNSTSLEKGADSKSGISEITENGLHIIETRHEVLNRIQSTHKSQQDKRLLVQNQPLQSQSVGFYAYMSQSESAPGKHHSLIFDVVKSQVGNGYNPNSGMFTASQDGVYVFSSTICMVHAYGSYDIVKNSEVQGTFFLDSSGINEWRYSSTTILVALTKGDVVFVRTSKTYQPHGDVHSDTLGRSSFVGWLLQ